MSKDIGSDLDGCSIEGSQSPDTVPPESNEGSFIDGLYNVGSLSELYKSINLPTTQDGIALDEWLLKVCDVSTNGSFEVDASAMDKSEEMSLQKKLAQRDICRIIELVIKDNIWCLKRESIASKKEEDTYEDVLGRLEKSLTPQKQFELIKTIVRDLTKFHLLNHFSYIDEALREVKNPDTFVTEIEGKLHVEVTEVMKVDLSKAYDHFMFNRSIASPVHTKGLGVLFTTDTALSTPSDINVPRSRSNTM